MYMCVRLRKTRHPHSRITVSQTLLHQRTPASLITLVLSPSAVLALMSSVIGRLVKPTIKHNVIYSLSVQA